MYNMNIQTMNIIGDLEISLLGFLLDKSRHGYELHRLVTDRRGFGGVWRLKIGNLYAMLNKLHEAELVSVKNYQSGNRPVRNVYQITKNGEAIFQNWIISPVVHGRDFRHLFFLKFYFALSQGKEKATKLLVAQKAECKKWQANFFTQISGDTNLQVNYQKLVIHYRIRQIGSDLEWLDWAEKIITEEEK